MKNTEAAKTIEAFPINEVEHIDVIQRGEYFYVIHVKDGSVIGERSAFGRFLVPAIQAASTWARGIAYDRSVVR